MKCHKCGASACCNLEHRKRWECESTATMGGFDQSRLCKERVKSQRLAARVKRLEEIMQSGWTVYAYRDVFHAQRVGHNVYSIRKTFNRALCDAEAALKKENEK